MNNVQNATELDEFVQNSDRPHGQPEPYHGEGTFGRSTYIVARPTLISRAEARELGLLAKTAWPERGRKVKKDELARYRVRGEERKIQGKMIMARGYDAFAIDQTQVVRKKKPKHAMPISLPKALPMNELKKSFGKNLDRVKVPLYVMTMKLIFDRRFRDAEDFINLYSPILQKFMGNKYRRMIDILNGWIIEVDEHYDFITEHRSKGYRFEDEILAEGFCHDFITDEQVIRQFEKPRPTARLDRHLWHYLTQLEVDESMLPMGELAWGQQHALENIIAGVWRYEADDYGRRHTNLTNLCRVGRNSLRYKGLPLVGLDVRNSQPLIFGIMVDGNLAE